MSETASVEVIRRIFTLFGKQEDQALLSLLDPEVELRTFTGRREVYRGHEGMEALMAEQRTARRAAALNHFWTRDDLVVAVGRLPPGELESLPQPLVWLFEMRLSRLLRLQPYATIDGALSAAEMAAAPLPDLAATRDLAQLPAMVVGRWANKQALLQLEHDHFLQAPAPSSMQGRFDVGDSAVAFLLANGDLAGWYLPQAKIGVDLRERNEE